MYRSGPVVTLTRTTIRSVDHRLVRRHHSLVNGTVIHSTSTDIFVNLSFEDWIYRNSDLSDKTVLLLWRNGPSVVVGRHQNPWRECHVSKCVSADTSVARRNSGGGTVYHDLNNLNLSFICDKRLYNRLNNLTFVGNVLSDKFGIDCRINERQDLVLSQTGHKISGTASKVGAKTAYHHLTLLIDVDMTRMRTFLRKEATQFKSKATESVPSKTANLSSVCFGIKLEDVLKEIAHEFTSTHKGSDDSVPPFNHLMANEQQFTGINEIEKNLRSWDWIYGKTPRFAITKQFDFNGKTFEIEINVFRGLIEKLMINGNESDIDFKGIRFSEEDVDRVLTDCLSNDIYDHTFGRLLTDSIRECVGQSV